jgi:iron complex transport system substrate-binding protein
MTVPADWQRVATETAALVNREAAGERMERRYEQRLEEVRAVHGDALKTTRFALIRGSEAGKWQADNAASWAGVVLADLGARLAAVSDFEGPPVKEYSDEQVSRLQDADVILIEGSPGTDRPDPESAALMRERLFERLPVARAGRVEALHFFYPLSYGQGLEVIEQIDDVLGRS